MLMTTVSLKPLIAGKNPKQQRGVLPNVQVSKKKGIGSIPLLESITEAQSLAIQSKSGHSALAKQLYDRVLTMPGFDTHIVPQDEVSIQTLRLEIPGGASTDTVVKYVRAGDGNGITKEDVADVREYLGALREVKPTTRSCAFGEMRGDGVTTHPSNRVSNTQPNLLFAYHLSHASTCLCMYVCFSHYAAQSLHPQTGSAACASSAWMPEEQDRSGASGNGRPGSGCSN
jgi:hypothetical protein